MSIHTVAKSDSLLNAICYIFLVMMSLWGYVAGPLRWILIVVLSWHYRHGCLPLLVVMLTCWFVFGTLWTYLPIIGIY